MSCLADMILNLQACMHRQYQCLVHHFKSFPSVQQTMSGVTLGVVQPLLVESYVYALRSRNAEAYPEL